MLKNIVSFIIKICISAVLLILLFKRIDFQQTVDCISKVEPFYFFCAVALFLLVVFLGVLRWSVLLKILDKDLEFGRIFVSHCGGLFFNVFLPSTIGGDVARTIDLSLHTKDSSAILATVFLDRLFGFLALVVITVTGFTYGYIMDITRDLRLLVFIAILTTLVTLAFLAIFSQHIFLLLNRIIPFKGLKDYLAKFHDCCYSFRLQKIAMLKAFVLSLCIQGLFAVVAYSIGKSLGINLGVVYYLILFPIINTISFLPISLGGLGLRDNVAVTLFSTYGAAADKVAAMTLLIFALLLSVGIIGGIIYGAALHNRRLQRN